VTWTRATSLPVIGRNEMGDCIIPKSNIMVFVFFGVERNAIDIAVATSIPAVASTAFDYKYHRKISGRHQKLFSPSQPPI